MPDVTNPPEGMAADPGPPTAATAVSADHGSSLMRWGMIACCAVMLLPVAGYVAAEGTPAGLAQNATVFLPLALCLGMHVVMHRFMGRSCHGAASKAGSSAVGDDPTAIVAERTSVSER